MRLENTGTVDSRDGTLALREGGTSSGHVTYDAGTTLEFNSQRRPSFTFSLEPTAAAWSATGRLLVVRNNVFIEGDGLMDVAPRWKRSALVACG
jgi:hypothetical protein